MFNQQFSLDMHCEKYQMFQVSVLAILIMNCCVILAISASLQSPEPCPSLQGAPCPPWVPLAEHRALSPLQDWALAALPSISPKGRAANPHRALEQPVHPFTCKESTGTANGMWVAAAKAGIQTRLLWLNLLECENVV